MRIMYFLDDGQSFGGAANTLLQQAVLMKKNGADVCIVISNYEYEEIDCGYNTICEGANVEVRRLPFRISSHPEDIDVVCMVEHYVYIRDSIKEFSPDILHSVQINAVVEMVSRELEIPHIMNIYPLHSAFFSIEYMNVFPHFHLCDSEYYAERWERYLQTDSKCIRTVVIRKRAIEREYVIGKETVFVCVGSIYKEKNQLEVIKAFHRALEAGVKGRLLLYGYATGAYARLCDKYIKENGLRESVILKGFVADMYEEYAKADVLICGSMRESYPNVISEALAYGLIVVSTPVAGVPEVIKDGVNGYLCNDYSDESIMKKIIQCFKGFESDESDLIRKNAHDTFLKEHSEDSVKEKLMSYYSYVQTSNYDSSSKVRIEEIRKFFKEIIDVYKKNRHAFNRPLHVQKKLWYIWHIMPIINKQISQTDKKVYIWGTGELAITAHEIIDIFFTELQVDGYLDTYREGYFGGFEILKPQDVLIENCLIFIGTYNGQDEIIDMLENNGKEFNKDFFIIVPRRW